MEQDPQERAVGKVEAVAAGDWVGWEDPWQQGRATSVCVRNAATGSLTKQESPAFSRNAHSAGPQWPGGRCKQKKKKK